MAKNTKGGLGRGFGALLSDSLFDDAQTLEGVSTLPVALIEPNANQPRKQFDYGPLQELTESITQHGVITPITVRKQSSGYYQIIAGERRWRACRAAGVTEIPAMVVEASDEQVMEWALIENLQRQDLNPMEEAQGYAQLMETYHLSQEAVAERVGKSRSTIANALRLLHADEFTKSLVKDCVITAGHARAALTIQDENRRAQEIGKMGQMNVRQAEEYAKQCNRAPQPQYISSNSLNYEQIVCAKLEEKFGRKINIYRQGKHGKLQFTFYDTQDLENLLKTLENMHG